MIGIRLATPADLDFVIALEARVFGDEAWSPRSIEAEFEQLSQSREILVATDGAEIVGYAVLLYAGGSGDLPRIAVDRELRRQGLASRLVDAVVDRARELNLDQILLEVAADNEPALGLYAAKGLGEIDRRPRYYADGRDAIVMRLSVDDGAGSALAGEGHDG